MSTANMPAANTLPTDPVNTTQPVNECRVSWDVAKAIKLRLHNGLSYREIAQNMGVNHAAVYRRIAPLIKAIDDPQANQAYDQNRVQVLTGIERELVANLVNSDKLEKASLNNVAYAFQQVHNARRLESGLSTENVDLHAAYAKHLAEQEDHAKVAQALHTRLVELGVTPSDDSHNGDNAPGPALTPAT